MVVIGGLVCAGWILDIGVLQRLHPALASMKLNTSVSLMLLGTALWLSVEPPVASQAWKSRLLAAFAGAIAGVSLLEYAVGIDLGIDELVFRDHSSTAAPGRMSPMTGVCLLALGVAIVWLESRWTEWLALLIALFTLLALLGYLYGVQDLYSIGPYSSVALHTALALCALAFGLVLARPHRTVMRLVVSDLSGGALARQLVPAAIVVPPVLALLRQWGEHAGLYGTGFGRAMLVASNIVVFVGLILRTASALSRSDQQRRAAEAAARENRARKTAILESALDAVLSVDVSGIVAECNPAAEAMFGRTRAEIIGRPLAVVLTVSGPGEQTRLAQDLTGANPSAIGKRIELTAHRSDGSEFPVELSITRVDLDGPPIFTAFIRDMTEAHQARTALLRSNDRLRTLSDISHAFAMVATGSQVLLERIAQVTADLVGDGCHVTLLSEDGQHLLNVANAHRDAELALEYRKFLAGLTVSTLASNTVSATVARTGVPARGDIAPELMVAQTDEALRPIVHRMNVHSFAVVPIRVRQAVIGTLSIVRSRPGCSYSDADVTLLQDVSDRAGLAIETARLYADLEQRVKDRTGALEAVNQELEAFSYSVAHDLRAPLRAVAGYAQVLSEDHAGQLDADGAGYLRNICDAATRMGHLIDDLLRLSRIGRSKLRRERVEVSKLVHTVVDRLRTAEPDRIVDVLVEDGLVAEAEPELLDIVLTNLLGNAWKFTGKRAEARIEFSARAAEPPVTYLVRDNGAGFDATYASKLFGAFQRLHTTREFEGTGLGLATVRRVIHHHGGRVWAEGEVGRGATFFFTLEAAGS